MADINPTTAIITLSVNDLDKLIKYRDCQRI